MLGGNQRRARTSEGVKHNTAEVGVHFDTAPRKLHRHKRRAILAGGSSSGTRHGRNLPNTRIVARHTVDEKVLRALRSKADLAKTLVDDYRSGLNPFAS